MNSRTDDAEQPGAEPEVDVEKDVEKETPSDSLVGRRCWPEWTSDKEEK
jgi:hypothetical protein